ncbi:hypothetical protein F5B19DRAFT_493333 [Rostrohypoxylon terebratum]|nr:hypothetical protein F5B19DRAFT_493333 [Rostrohypoxylon terebratum]
MPLGPFWNSSTGLDKPPDLQLDEELHLRYHSNGKTGGIASFNGDEKTTLGLKFGPLEECASPSKCHSIYKSVYNSFNDPYCAYHTRKNAEATGARRRFFARMGYPSHLVKELDLTTPILGRLIGGAALSSAYAGSADDFPDKCNATNVPDDSSDESESGKPPVNQKPWDWRDEADKQEFEERKEDFWIAMATPAKSYYVPSMRAAKSPWGTGPMKKGPKKSKTWIQWKKYQKKKAEAKAKDTGVGEGDNQGSNASESACSEVKESSELLSTTELEIFADIQLAEEEDAEFERQFQEERSGRQQAVSVPWWTWLFEESKKYWTQQAEMNFDDESDEFPFYVREASPSTDPSMAN